MTACMKTSSLLCAVMLFACVDRQTGSDSTGHTGGTTGPDGGGETSGMPTTSGDADGGHTDSQSGVESSGLTGSAGSETANDDSCGVTCGTTGMAGGPCDVYAQDCPEGEKCAPYAEGGGSSWNAVKCLPVMGSGQPGEPCAAQGSGLSGVDDCAEGVLCWFLDDMDQGTCVEMCGGSKSQPICDGATFCALTTGDGTVNLCFLRCDPLVQDCPGEDLCLPTYGDFICIPDTSGEGGAVFDPCLVACDKGFLCKDPSLANECDQNAGGCCLPFCDLTDPDLTCPGVGQTCASLYDEGMAPPAYAHIGLCILPE